MRTYNIPAGYSRAVSFRSTVLGWLRRPQGETAASSAVPGQTELAALAERFVPEKIENAELFRILVALAHGKGKEIEPAVKAYAAAAVKRMTTKPEKGINPRYYDYDDENRSPNQLHPSEFLFAMLCLKDPALVPHGEEFFPQAGEPLFVVNAAR